MAINPWRTLKNSPELLLKVRRLPDGAGGGAYLPATKDAMAVIYLDDRLGQRGRNAVVAHELEHHLAGGPCAGPSTAWRNCQRIWDRVADQLVPPDELRVFWVRAEQTGQNVHAHEVAEHFHVPESLAERAMRRLLQRLP